VKRRLAIALVATLALAVVAVAVHRPVLRAAGRVLVVESPRERADAIVVVAGSFREGLAPLVLVSRQFVPNRVRQLIDLGIRPLDFQGESVAALEKYGVPRNAIITLAEPVEITETEVRGVVAAARARGWHRVLLVTTAFHSRRVRLIWSREAGPGIEAGVAVVHDECSSGPAWWRRRRCSETVLHEYLGLLALYLHISSLMR